MGKFVAILLALVILSGCATFNVSQQNFDPNYNCTEAALKAYRFLTSTGNEYRLVIGFRYDIIGEDVGYGGHAWIEYKEPDGEWKVFDTYITVMEDMVSRYVPVIWGKDAEKYFIVEDKYHQMGYDAQIVITSFLDENGNNISYIISVLYKLKDDTEWKRHSF